MFDEIERTLAALPLGSIAFNTPAELEVGETAVIQLRLSLQKPATLLEAELTQIGSRQGANIHVSPLMQARLTGSGFKIEALRPERQAVTRRRDAEWRWEIEGTERGLHRLHLSISALITVDGEPAPGEIHTFDRPIEIRVTWDKRMTGFVDQNWQWLTVSVLIPAIGFGWAAWRRRRAALTRGSDLPQ